MIDFLKSVMSIDLINLGLTFVKYVYYISKIFHSVFGGNKSRISQAKQIDVHVGKGDFVFDFHLSR